MARHNELNSRLKNSVYPAHDPAGVLHVVAMEKMMKGLTDTSLVDALTPTHIPRGSSVFESGT